MANLAQYLKAGGFVFGDVVGDYGEGLEKYGDLVRGKDFWSERLPENHPVYTAFFDLSGGMPFGYSGLSLAQGKSGVRPWNYLTGHFVKGRGRHHPRGWRLGLAERGPRWEFDAPAAAGSQYHHLRADPGGIHHSAPYADGPLRVPSAGKTP
jgi:hypothetical protein